MDFVLQEDGPAYVGPDTAAQPGVGERPQRHPAQDGADRGWWDRAVAVCQGPGWTGPV